MKQKGFSLLPIIIITVLLGIVGYFIYQNTQLQKSSGDPIVAIFSPSPLSKNVPNVPSINATPSSCIIDSNPLINRSVSTFGQKCKFSMFDDYGKELFNFIYPKGWKSSIVGAAGSNIRLLSKNNDTLYVYQTLTNLPVESLEKSEICYEGCSPIVDSTEKVLSKTVENYGSVKSLKLITTLNANKIERLFLMSNLKYNSGYLLLVFEFPPSSVQYENEVTDILKSLEFVK